MASWLTAVGSDALVLVWWPVALWTAAALLTLAVLRLLPERFSREQYELRTILLVALPAGIALAAVVREVALEPLIVVTLPYEIVVRANGAASAEIIDLSSIAGVSTGSLVFAAGAAFVALFGVFSFAADLRALWRFRHELREVSDPHALALLDEALAQNGARRPVRLVSSPDTRSPAAFGWFHPTVLVPGHLLDNTDELRLILLHETAHLARGDFALDTAARLVRTLFGWHPLVAHLFRTRAFWREAACDMAVLATDRVDRSDYARLLLSVSTGEPTHQPAFVASMAASPSQLTRRIEAMTRIKAPATTLPAVRHVLAFLTLALVVTFTACSDTTPAAVGPESESPTAAADTAPKTDDAFMVVEQMPEMEGGISGLASAITYPDGAKKDGVEGRVIVSFIVEKDGSVTGATVEKGVHDQLDAEALRAIESLHFEPGMQRGEPVRVKMALPITFKLN